MSDPISTKEVHKSFIDAFYEACKTYFNNELLEGALTIPMGVPVDFKTHTVACQPIMRATDVIGGHGPQRVKDAVKALFTQVVHSRRDGLIPVFRTKPGINCGGLDPQTLCWHVGLWCDMAWVGPDADVTGLPSAWT